VLYAVRAICVVFLPSTRQIHVFSRYDITIHAVIWVWQKQQTVFISKRHTVWFMTL